MNNNEHSSYQGTSVDWHSIQVYYIIVIFIFIGVLFVTMPPILSVLILDSNTMVQNTIFGAHLPLAIGVAIWTILYLIFLLIIRRKVRKIRHFFSENNLILAKYSCDLWPSLVGIVIWGGSVILLQKIVAAYAVEIFEIDGNTSYYPFLFLTIFFLIKYLTYYLNNSENGVRLA